MKKLHQSKTAPRILLLSVLISIVFSASCLPSNAPPLGGIAVITFEAIENIPNSAIVLPNVPVKGNLLRVLGPGPGNVTGFGGGSGDRTDVSGTYASPNARTNASWEVSAGPIKAPPCQQGTDVEDVPSEGAFFKFICITLHF